MADGKAKFEVELEDNKAEEKLDDIGEAAENLGEKTKESSKETEKAQDKYRELTEIIAKQENQLEELSGAYVHATVNFGKNSKEAGELEAQISELSAELKKNKSVIEEAEAAAKKAASGFDDLGDGAGDAEKGLDGVGDGAGKAGKGFDVMSVSAGSLIAEGITALIGGLKNLVGSFIALAEETREYREDVAKLNAAFTTAGHTTETANKVYKDFYKILGESDRSIEAVNHLAEFTKNEKELAQWGTIVAGVTARFGDSLPIEGLTEAANETAKVGAVTGPLADALNWAGISEDDFNKKLEKCNSEQERAALITNTLTKEYQSAADAYNEMTKSTQDARDAQADLEEKQAEIGAAIEPMTTAWTRLRSKGYEAVIPVINAVSKAFEWIGNWMKEHPKTAAVIVSVVEAIANALAILVGVLVGVLAIVAVLLVVWFAFETGFLGMIAGIAGLILAFKLLWENCEGFREFWIGLWGAIQTAALFAWDLIKQGFALAWEYIKEKWNEAQPYFMALWEIIKAVFSVVSEVLSAYFSNAWERIQILWAQAQPYFSQIWESIKVIFAEAKEIFGLLFGAAWQGVKIWWDLAQPYFSVLWEVIKAIFKVVEPILSGYFAAAWEMIQYVWRGAWAFFAQLMDSIAQIFSIIKDVLSGNFSEAWKKIKALFSDWKSFFGERLTDLLGVFGNIYDEFKDVGDNILKGIWAGIQAGWDWLKGKVKSLASMLFTTAEEELDINSPSKKGEYIGEMYSRGIGVGEDKELSRVEDTLRKRLSGMQARLQATVSAENARYGYASGTPDTGFSELARAVNVQTAGINSLASAQRGGSLRPVVLTLDKRELGRAVVDVSGAESVRVGTRLATGGAI